MPGIIIVSLISAVAVAVTGLIAYEILRYVWGLLPKLTIQPRLRVLIIIAPIFCVHILNIWLYAGIYYLLIQQGGFGELAGTVPQVENVPQDFLILLYFSSVTYTSLGFGDIIPTGDIRMLASTEVLNGLVMIGWTVSFTYLTMEKFWALPHRKSEDGKQYRDS